MKEKMKFLIGYDGSHFADAGLDDLRRAGLPREAKAIVLTVSELWLPYITDNHVTQPSVSEARAGSGRRDRAAPAGAKPVTEARALALEGKTRLQKHFPDWNIEAEESSGSPAREILSRASDWKPDLIAVGFQGRSGLGRFLLGSVSQKVINEARCSVRVARGTAWKNGSPIRILIALDGSPGSAAAVQSVSVRMWPQGSEVRLITIVDSSNGAGVTEPASRKSPDSSNAASRPWVQGFLDAAANKLRAINLVVSTRVDQGDPKPLIIANAVEWGAECIFIGASSALNPLEQFLLGSVATAVVSRAHCSVEVVR